MTSAAPVTDRPSVPSRSPAPTLVLIGISLGYFMVLLDMTVLSVAEPDLARSLHSSVGGLQWVVTAYTVAFSALLLSAGAIADRYGAHRSFRTGITAFGLGSLLCAVAPNLWTLVAMRGLLGVAAAATVPASMAMIAALYPQPAVRAKAVAVWAAISGAALAAGPIVGGLLVGMAGWRAIFLINVPLAAITLALTAGRATTYPRNDRRIDWIAQLAVCLALGVLTEALIALDAGRYGPAAMAAGAAVAAGGLFVVLERRSPAPVIPPSVLRAPGMRGALFAAAAVNFTMSGVLFVLPLLFQQTLRLSPIEVGLAFLPMTLPFAVNPLLTGRLVARVGPRPPVLIGLGLLAGSGLLLGYAIADSASYSVIVGGLVGTGFGVSLALPALVTTVVTTAPAGAAGAASGLLNATRQVGATLAVAVMGAFITVNRPGADHAALGLLMCAAICALAGLALIRRR